MKDIAKLESKKDLDEHELRPVYGVARSDADDSTKPIGWAFSASQAARMINKHLSEETGTLDRLKGSDLYFSRYLLAWFVEE